MAVKISPESEPAYKAFMDAFSQMPTDRLITFYSALKMVSEQVDAMPTLSEPTATEFMKHFSMFTTNMRLMLEVVGTARLTANAQPLTDAGFERVQ